MRRALGVVLALVPLLLAAPAAAQQPPVVDGVAGSRVVVVGVPGLRWDDVDVFRTPALSELAGRSATGVLSVKALPGRSCPADGWLTLGAGSRAQAFDVPCGALTTGDRELLQRRNSRTRDAADVDALAAALREAGLCLAARGEGAELAGGDPLRACPVLLVDGPTVGGDAAGRAARAAEADALVAAVDAARMPGSTLLVVGLSGAPGDDGPHLHLALASGPEFADRALRSPSTGRTPYVQLVDVAPTVLDLAGVPVPSPMRGQPWRDAAGRWSVDQLADLDRRATAARSATVPFFVALVGALLAALAAGARSRSAAVVEVAGLSAVAAVALSYLSALAPWWRAPAPAAVLVAGVLLAAVATALLARRTARPVLLVVGGLALVLAADLATGARLQLDTPAGYSPLVAGRFAGIGNVAFGVFAAAVLLGLALLTDGMARRRAAVVAAGGGALAVVLDGAPGLGSDVGGVLALTPAVVVLAMLRGGARVTVPRLAAAGAGAAALVTVFALVDYARPRSDRTHLGRFVQQVAEGTAGTVLRRKLAAIADLLLANAVTALLPLLVAVALYLVARPPRHLRAVFEDVPAWRHGLLALGVASALGFAANDSGPAVPALALLVAAPATVALAARVAARRAGAPATDG